MGQGVDDGVTWRVDIEAAPERAANGTRSQVGNVHLQIGNEKWYYNPKTGDLINKKTGKMMSKAMRKKLPSKVFASLRKGVEQLEEHGITHLKVGNTTVKLTGFAVGLMVTFLIDSAEVLAELQESRDYRKLLEYIENEEWERAHDLIPDIRDDITAKVPRYPALQLERWLENLLKQAKEAAEKARKEAEAEAARKKEVADECGEWLEEIGKGIR